MIAETQHQQVLDEARQWIDQLKSYVGNINELKNKLYKWAPGKFDRDVLIQIEHYHNQFHIQQINLHDLKHSIRHYIQEFKFSPEADHSRKHQQLEEQFNFLICDLDQINADFTRFIAD